MNKAITAVVVNCGCGKLFSGAGSTLTKAIAEAEQHVISTGHKMDGMVKCVPENKVFEQ